MKAHELLEQIKKDPKPFLAAGKGVEFENRISNALDKLGYNRIQRTDLEKRCLVFFG